ncbi:MAG: GGDEF domain-containing protein [Eubacterium sp.]
MFYNNRKTIALFCCNSHGEFQREICAGAAEETERLGYNLAIFTCYGNYGQNALYARGEKDIFSLPDYHEFAGIIIAGDTFSIDEAVEEVIDYLREKADCPVVSLRQRMEGVNNILIDNFASMGGMIRHLIECHGAKDIAFMTGKRQYADAQERLQSFYAVMKEYDLPVSEHRVFFGNFWKNKGKEACDWFMEEGKCPDAIACANDYMAMAVIDELYKRGLSVPHDVIVTGYDGIKSGLIYSPSVTTVRVDFNDMAKKAVALIDKHQNDKEIEDLYLMAELKGRESCGCLSDNHSSIVYSRCMNHDNIVEHDNLEMQFCFMNIQFGRVERFEEINSILERYIYNIEGFNNYLICLRDDIMMDDKELKTYTDTMEARVVFHNRKNLGNVRMEFERNELIPQELASDEPQCYVFSPLHFQDECYGYEAYSFESSENAGKLYIRWSMAIDDVIMNILVKSKMKRAIDELEIMYIQDAMTGLFNRRGFEKYARVQFMNARARDSMVCVIGIDMDGLKPINDIYGHHEGDSALRSVGYAIQEAAVSGQIGARIGGDEFEVLFPCQDEEDVKNWVRVFERSLDNYNNKSNKPYKIYASLGYKMGIPGAGDTLESYMRESDDIMYHNKMTNKMKRNQTLR